MCSLVRSETNYRRLIDSFARRGFGAETTEFLALDNRGGNAFDGYSGLRAAARAARGRYLVFTHDDVELLEDGREDLERQLELLTGLDPRWCVAGNAGPPARGWRFRGTVRHLSDGYGSDRIVGPPVEVAALDENFLVLRMDRLVLPSHDLHGFHHYGADICRQAALHGGTCYVIPFFLRHHSAGNFDGDFEASRRRFARKYRRLLGDRLVPTTCGKIPLGPISGLEHTMRRAGYRTLSVFRQIRKSLRGG